MAINRIKTFFTIAYYGLVVIGCRRKGLFLVYSLEENGSAVSSTKSLGSSKNLALLASDSALADKVRERSDY